MSIMSIICIMSIIYIICIICIICWWGLKTFLFVQQEEKERSSKVPSNSHQEARSRLFCDALTYALTEEEACEIIDSSDAAFRLYLKGLMLAGTFTTFLQA